VTGAGHIVRNPIGLVAGLLFSFCFSVFLGPRPMPLLPASSLDRQLALTPPMGYDDWNAFQCRVSEQLIEQTAAAMVSSGMKAAGYQYVNIDDCWQAPVRAANGRLQADPATFPDGIGSVARYVHALDLKLGIYEDAGTKTCAGYPGSYGHEAQDAATFASWGVDYLKYDWCNIPYSSFLGWSHEQVGRWLYTRMRADLLATGRPIVFSISNPSDDTLHPWGWAGPIANLWRTTPDISDSWSSVLRILDQNDRLAAYVGPRHWNDPDMLEVGNGGMTEAEDRAHFSLWSIMAAPLIAGTDIRTMSTATRAILTNPEVIAVDQDPLALQGRVVSLNGNREVMMKPLANGDLAVALLNRGAPGMAISVSTGSLGLPVSRAYSVRDLWAHTTHTSKAIISAVVPAHSVVMLRVRHPEGTRRPVAHRS
jgi:alpha-galactosidase